MSAPRGMVGSSPLTRGKRLAVRLGEAVAGLIPAHAGKTTTPFPRSRSWWAHPRSRGENSGSSITTASPTGSSPLTRGKLSDSNQPKLIQRLIPAHAGKTSAGRSRPGPPWAHPRSRGENRPGQRGVLHRVGSSPLTRGKRRKDRLRLTRLGLIPAHAGKTFVLMRGPPGSWAHPRSRGENVAVTTPSPFWQGSSPLTRGKHLAAAPRPSVDGLIPAHAGKTARD